MNLIKASFIDILMTLFIVAAVWSATVWMYWVIMVYSALILLLRLIDFSGEGFQGMLKQPRELPPDWPFHILYGLNILILLYAGWYILTAIWAGIWLFSWLKQRKTRARKAQMQAKAKER